MSFPRTKNVHRNTNGSLELISSGLIDLQPALCKSLPTSRAYERDVYPYLMLSHFYQRITLLPRGCYLSICTFRRKSIFSTNRYKHSNRERVHTCTYFTEQLPGDTFTLAQSRRNSSWEQLSCELRRENLHSLLSRKGDNGTCPTTTAETYGNTVAWWIIAVQSKNTCVYGRFPDERVAGREITSLHSPICTIFTHGLIYVLPGTPSKAGVVEAFTRLLPIHTSCRTFIGAKYINFPSLCWINHFFLTRAPSLFLRCRHSSTECCSFRYWADNESLNDRSEQPHCFILLDGYLLFHVTEFLGKLHFRNRIQTNPCQKYLVLLSRLTSPPFSIQDLHAHTTTLFSFHYTL